MNATQPPVDFLHRPHSTQWEPISDGGSPETAIWVWCKPQNYPQGIVLRLPALPVGKAGHTKLSLRQLLGQAGYYAEQAISWTVNGMVYLTNGGANPLLDHPLPLPTPGMDPHVYVEFTPIPASMPVYSLPANTGTIVPKSARAIQRPATQQELELLEGIDAEWNNSLAMENELNRQRKLLTDMIGKLKGLNRDLNADERTFSSSQDKKDWQDARRWLRDCSATLNRCLKEFDIGFTSKAGQRTWFEETYTKHVKERIPFDGLQKAHADYQIYHKSLQTLLSSIKSGIQHSSQNGERRAQRILAAIAAKVRQGNSRNSFLDVISGG